MKTCNRCGEGKYRLQFPVDSRRKDGLGGACKACRKVDTDAWRLRNKDRVLDLARQYAKDNYAATRYNNMVQGAKKRGHAVGITRDEFVAWYESEEKFCHYCGIYEDLAKESTSQNLGVDRKDNAIGYESGNIVLACRVCNTGKLDIFSHNDWMQIARKYIAPRYQVPVFEDGTI